MGESHRRTPWFRAALAVCSAASSGARRSSGRRVNESPSSLLHIAPSSTYLPWTNTISVRLRGGTGSGLLRGRKEKKPTLLMGCSSPSLCRLQRDRECDIWSPSFYVENEMSQIPAAALKMEEKTLSLCVLIFIVMVKKKTLSRMQNCRHPACTQNLSLFSETTATTSAASSHHSTI